MVNRDRIEEYLGREGRRQGETRNGWQVSLLVIFRPGEMECHST